MCPPPRASWDTAGTQTTWTPSLRQLDWGGCKDGLNTNQILPFFHICSLREVSARKKETKLNSSGLLDHTGAQGSPQVPLPVRHYVIQYAVLRDARPCPTRCAPTAPVSHRNALTPGSSSNCPTFPGKHFRVPYPRPGPGAFPPVPPDTRLGLGLPTSSWPSHPLTDGPTRLSIGGARHGALAQEVSTVCGNL